MNQVIILFLLLSSLIAFDSNAQNNRKLNKPVKVKFTKGDATIIEVDPYQNDWKIEKGHKAVGVTGEEEKLFVDYWTVPSLQQYRSLFYMDEYPELTENNFKSWRQGYNNKVMRVKGKIYFNFEGYELCAFQYNTFNNSFFVKESFFIKKINGKWYPVSKAENKRFKELKPFFTVVKPEGVSSILADVKGFKDKKPHLKKDTDTLLKKIKTNGKVDGETAAMLLQQEVASANNEVIDELAYTETGESQIQSTREAPVIIRSQHTALVQYMDSLKLQPAAMEEVLGLIVNEDFVGAAYKIEQYAQTGTNHNHVMKIREIYGSDKINIISFPSKP